MHRTQMRFKAIRGEDGTASYGLLLEYWVRIAQILEDSMVFDGDDKFLMWLIVANPKESKLEAVVDYCATAASPSAMDHLTMYAPEFTGGAVTVSLSRSKIFNIVSADAYDMGAGLINSDTLIPILVSALGRH